MASVRMRWSVLAALALLAACGGGGGTDGGGTTPAPGLQDTTPYSTAPGGALAEPNENAAITSHAIVVDGRSIAYTATTGHLTPRSRSRRRRGVDVLRRVHAPTALGTSRPSSSSTTAGPARPRCGCTSARSRRARLVTGDPATRVPQPFQLVDNAESLLDVADLVFVDAVGTGYSQAIAPHTNRTSGASTPTPR